MDRPHKPDDGVASEPLDLMRRFWQLNHAIERLSKRMEAMFGVTAQQRMVLRWVGKFPGMTAGRLAEHLHLDAGTVSTALGRIERKGLLERRRDHRDRRRLALGLTAAGRALDHPAVGTFENAVRRLLNETPPSDVETTRKVLEALTRLIDAEANRGGGTTK
jgi:MarR family transcriptional regulator, organic hydroperoxide resistance regulator